MHGGFKPFVGIGCKERRFTWNFSYAPAADILLETSIILEHEMHGCYVGYLGAVS
jgi:hypothetical protein